MGSQPGRPWRVRAREGERDWRPGPSEEPGRQGHRTVPVPPVVVPSQSSVSAQLQPGSCGPASALCRNLLVIGMLHSGLLGQQPLPSRRKATLRPVSASLRLGREAGTRPSSFWTEAAPSKERREDGRSHARGRAAEAGGNRHRLCPLGAGGCHAAAQGAAGRAGPRLARPGSVGGKPSTRRREGVGGAEPRDRPGAPRGPSAPLPGPWGPPLRERTAFPELPGHFGAGPSSAPGAARRRPSVCEAGRAGHRPHCGERGFCLQDADLSFLWFSLSLSVKA